jgi:hypothetical protein
MVQVSTAAFGVAEDELIVVPTLSRIHFEWRLEYTLACRPTLLSACIRMVSERRSTAGFDVFLRASIRDIYAEQMIFARENRKRKSSDLPNNSHKRTCLRKMKMLWRGSVRRTSTNR